MVRAARNRAATERPSCGRPNQALQWTPPSDLIPALTGLLLPRIPLGGATELCRSAAEARMFGWFRKKQEAAPDPPKRVVDPVLRGGVDAMVAFLQASPAADDDAIVRHLTGRGVAESQVTKLVQFVPIAFTRFLYRAAGVRFAPNYVLLGADGQPKSQHPVADEPAYREAWGHCEDAAARAAGEGYFVLVAARSGGYRALQDFIRQGLNLNGVITGPPMMLG